MVLRSSRYLELPISMVHYDVRGARAGAVPARSGSICTQVHSGDGLGGRGAAGTSSLDAHQQLERSTPMNEVVGRNVTEVDINLDLWRGMLGKTAPRARQPPEPPWYAGYAGGPRALVDFQRPANPAALRQTNNRTRKENKTHTQKKAALVPKAVDFHTRC